MSILTRNEILRQIEKGSIVIDPFDPNNVGPNSIDLHLGSRLYKYDREVLDAENPTKLIEVLHYGLKPCWLLKPGVLYLGSTLEYTETHDFVPYIDGRSSLGRLGVFAHITAGRGDIGFVGRWTVEISVVQPIILYPRKRYFQITYHTVEGNITGNKARYQGRYQGDMDPMPSKINSKD